jgi:hypothetical protein
MTNVGKKLAGEFMKYKLLPVCIPEIQILKVGLGLSHLPF